MKTEDLQGVVHSDPEIMGGTPVFVGTRVPLQNLIDYREGGGGLKSNPAPMPAIFEQTVNSQVNNNVIPLNTIVLLG